jgi:serine/threonine protein kinase
MEIEKDVNIIKQIGKGSFSNVFLCSDDKEINKEEYFIIKEININELIKKYKRKNNKNTVSPSKERDKERDKEHEYYYNRLEEMIESEIEILLKLDHLNIIKFYGYTKKRGVYYLRMEYCNGGDVYEYLKNKSLQNDKNIERNCFGGFSDEFMQNFIRQTSNGLKYIHDKNIIHRDIKLHNILMHKTPNGIEFKISDFGFSCYDLSNLSNEKNEKVQTNLSKKYFKLSGTPYYMAPEIILNMKKMENITSYKKNKIFDLYFYDKRIDIWSLGICIYELIFNLLPFSNINNIKELERFYSMSIIQEIMDKKINKKIFLNENIKTLLLGMLQIRINKRYTIEDVILQSNTQLYSKENNINSEIKYIKDIIDIKENNYKLNEDMKQHIIRNPVSIVYSWEHITFDELKVEKIENVHQANDKNGFLQWFYNKLWSQN